MAKSKLTDKQRKFVKAKVAGKNNIEAYKDAGYAVMESHNANKVNAHKVAHMPTVQEAINEALEISGATPEFAVRQLKKIADQDDEMGAKRLASMNILELHGWNKADRPTMTLDIKNAFFGGGRQTDGPDKTGYIEAE